LDEHVDRDTYSPATPIEADDIGRSFDPSNPRHAVQQFECYQYQSCEHPEWSDSSARRYTQDVIRELGRSPLPRSDGEDIVWGV